MSNVFVFRPGGPSSGNVFSDWVALMLAMGTVDGRKFLEFDDSVETCRIPPGTWPMRDVMWGGFGPHQTRPRSKVEILDGARFTELRMIGAQITIVNKATSISPISDFLGRAVVHIGVRDDCGTAQIVNQGTVALFDLDTRPGQFFVQNCLFGMPTLDAPSTFPIVRHKGPASELSLEILGLNQTGPNVVRSEAGATVRFVALSSAAQLATEQTSITAAGHLRFGPIGRIQRLILPPNGPATSSQGQAQGLLKPNVLIRCDGTNAFTQILPKIDGGFTFGSPILALYSGGQEVVVAEVVGGNHL
jgi:hypothetical protein